MPDSVCCGKILEDVKGRCWHSWYVDLADSGLCNECDMLRAFQGSRLDILGFHVDCVVGATRLDSIRDFSVRNALHDDLTDRCFGFCWFCTYTIYQLSERMSVFRQLVLLDS